MLGVLKNIPAERVEIIKKAWGFELLDAEKEVIIAILLDDVGNFIMICRQKH